MTRTSRVRLRVRPVVASLVAVLAWSSTPVVAQVDEQAATPTPYTGVPNTPGTADWSDEIPAHLAVVDGAADLERDGSIQPAEENLPLLAGDRLRTGRGRVEVLFADGSALDLDHDTDLDLLSDVLVRLEAGSIRLLIARGASELAYRVDAAGTTTWIRSAGEYRLDVAATPGAPEVRVRVLRGAAELASPFGRTLVRTGAEARATSSTEPSLPFALNVAAWDSFDRWVRDQHEYRVGRASAEYLPAELRHYGGAFDRDGAWEHAQGYGYVWYPRVASGWQPYYDGGWSFVGSFGWTWVGVGGRWTWPTHHYGRWGVRSGRWFWVPGRRWAPAWVSWATAPGYVSWCPLGFDNRPVFAITNVTVYNGALRHRWATLPSGVFVPGTGSRRHVIRARAIDAPAGAPFVLRAEAPVRPALLATRKAEPLRAPTARSTRYAVPRAALSSAARPDVVSTSSSASAAEPSARRRIAPAVTEPFDQRTTGPETGARQPRARAATPAREPSATLRTAPPGGTIVTERPSTYRLARPRGSSSAPLAPPSASPLTTRSTREVASPSPGMSSRDERRPAAGRSPRTVRPSPEAPTARPEAPRGDRTPARTTGPRVGPRTSPAPPPPRIDRGRPANPPAGRQEPASRGRAESRERR